MRETKSAPARRSAAERLDTGVLRDLIGFHVRRAQVAVYADFMRDAPVAGITPGQIAVMISIEHNPGITQQRLSDGLGVEKSTLVVRLHRLARRGFLRRVRSTRDKRENALELTAGGRRALRAMLAHIDRHEERVFAKLSRSERKQLVQMLRRVG